MPNPSIFLVSHKTYGMFLAAGQKTYGIYLVAAKPMESKTYGIIFWAQKPMELIP